MHTDKTQTGAIVKRVEKKHEKETKNKTGMWTKYFQLSLTVTWCVIFTRHVRGYF